MAGRFELPGVEYPADVPPRPGKLPDRFADRARAALEFWKRFPNWTSLAVCRRFKLSASHFAGWLKRENISVEDFAGNG